MHAAAQRPGYGFARPADQSSLTLANLTALPHFAVSSAIILPKSSGEPRRISTPISANRCLILGSARPRLISALSLSTISRGVPRGAQTPHHELVSNPGTVAATVGVSGSVGSWTLLAIASARILPTFICAAMLTTSENITGTRPDKTSAIA